MGVSAAVIACSSYWAGCDPAKTSPRYPLVRSPSERARLVAFPRAPSAESPIIAVGLPGPVPAKDSPQRAHHGKRDVAAREFRHGGQREVQLADQLLVQFLAPS